jgi:hypothetical protein
MGKCPGGPQRKALLVDAVQAVHISLAFSYSNDEDGLNIQPSSSFE